MEKNYEIGGRTVTLRASLYTAIAYKALFGRDMLSDMERASQLNDKLSDSKDPMESAGLTFGIYQIYLQALYVFAKEGTPDLPAFETWLRSIENADIADIVKTVTELYFSTQKADRKNV